MYRMSLARRSLMASSAPLWTPEVRPTPSVSAPVPKRFVCAELTPMAVPHGRFRTPLRPLTTSLFNLFSRRCPSFLWSFSSLSQHHIGLYDHHGPSVHRLGSRRPCILVQALTASHHPSSVPFALLFFIFLCLWGRRLLQNARVSQKDAFVDTGEGSGQVRQAPDAR